MADRKEPKDHCQTKETNESRKPRFVTESVSTLEQFLQQCLVTGIGQNGKLIGVGRERS